MLYSHWKKEEHQGKAKPIKFRENSAYEEYHEEEMFETRRQA